METLNVPTQIEAERLAEAQPYIDAAKLICQDSIEGDYLFVPNTLEPFSADWIVLTGQGREPNYIENWVEEWTDPLRGEVDDETFELQQVALSAAIKLILAQRGFRQSLEAISTDESRSYSFRESE